MNVMEESFDVHGGPGEGADTGAESALEVVDVGGEQGTGVGSDLVHNADALTDDILQLVVVVLELVFLEEHDLGRLGNLNSNTGKALSLTDEGKDFAVKVDIELQVLVVTNEQSGLETGLCTVNFLLPLLSPHVLVREQGVTERVVVLHVLADVAAALLHQLLRELLHGDGYPVEQVARPGDGTRNGRQVTHHWWLLLVTLVVILDLLDLLTVLLEEVVVLGLEARFERVSVENALEFSEETERVNNGSDAGERLVDVLLEEGLDVRDVDVELNKVAVESVVSVLQKSVVLVLELGDVALESLQDGLDVLEVVLLESLELLDGREEIDELGHTATEQVESAENLGRREIELFGLGHVLQSLLGELVLREVGLVQLEALLEYNDELVMGDLILLPKNAVVHGGRALGGLLGDGAGTLESENVLFAVDDHLVGDLDKEASHALVSVVVAGNGVDHLDGVHQDGEGLLDGNWIAIVEGLDEAFESLEVFDVVLGLVEVLSDSQLDGAPVRESEVNSTVSVAVSLVGGSGGEDVTDSLAVFGLQLLGDGGEHAHAEFPVLKLVTGTFVLLVDALVVLLINSRLDLDRPALENSHELVDHILVNTG